MSIKVTTSDQCPFQGGELDCGVNHIDGPEKCFYEAIPSNCPLRTSPVTVELEGEQE